MTREELVNALRFIVDKCDSIINNEKYTPDDFTNDIVEDIAELCNHILDGDYGKLDESVQHPLPEGLDEAAGNYAIEVVPDNFIPDEGNGYKAAYTLPDIKAAFKAGAEWMAGQFEKNRLAACYLIDS